MNDEQYLNSDRGRSCFVDSPTARSRYRAALAERTALESQVARLERQLDVATHLGSSDPIDRLRQREMARQLLGPACQRLAAAIERCITLRPAAQPRPRRAAQPVVWLDQPASSRMPQRRALPPSRQQYMTKDMAAMHFKTGADWLDYCAATTGWRWGGRHG